MRTSNYVPATDDIKTCTSIKMFRQIFKYLKRDLILRGESQRLDDLKRFIDVFESDANALMVTKASQISKRRTRYAGEEKLPTHRDLKIFSDYIYAKERVCISKISTGYTSDKVYQQLLHLTAVDILLFKIIRPGETEGTEIMDYKLHKRVGINSEEYRQLSKDTQMQASKYIRIDIKGKMKDGIGSDYVTAENELGINFIIKYRSEYGVAPDNLYLFAETEDKLDAKNHKFLKIGNVLASLSEECSVKYQKIEHEIIRATKLRKKAGTFVSNSEDISKGKQLVLRHLEHKETIHNLH